MGFRARRLIARPNRLAGCLLSVSFMVLMAGCSIFQPRPEATPSIIAPSTTTAPTPFGPQSTATARPTKTPDPYQGLTIEDLASRQYGSGTLTVDQRNPTGGPFRRIFFDYPSDGLQIHGFMNIPDGEPPFPVVIILHGYVPPSDYTTMAYTTRYADALAQAGFLTIHPNLRNYPPSESGPNRFRVGFAVDVLNLVALVQKQGGQPGPLEAADPEAIGLFGHSMGGGVALRAITVDSEIQAALLYASMSGDERLNYQKIIEWSEGEEGQEALNTPEDTLRRISPIHHLDRIEAAISIHHGEADSVVPPAWSTDLCQRLKAMDHEVECYRYQGQPHTFFGEADQRLIQRAVRFFRQEFN